MALTPSEIKALTKILDKRQSELNLIQQRTAEERALKRRKKKCKPKLRFVTSLPPVKFEPPPPPPSPVRYPRLATFNGARVQA